MSILLRLNSYISNLDILKENPRLLSHTINVPHFDYISLLLVFDNSQLTLKKEECWNLLESTSTWTPLFESSKKWIRILFIISNSKLGIWICSHPRIYLNSQPNLYDFLTLDHTRLFQTNKQTTYLEHILHLVPPYYDRFKQVLSNFIFLCVRC